MNMLPFSKLFFVILIFSFTQHILSTCSRPGTAAGNRGTLLNKTISASLVSFQYQTTFFPFPPLIFFHSCSFSTFSFSTLYMSLPFSSFPFFVKKLLSGFSFFFKLIQTQYMRPLSLHYTFFPWEFRDIHNFWLDLALSVPPLKKIGCQLMRISFPLLPWNLTLLPESKGWAFSD